MTFIHQLNELSELYAVYQILKEQGWYEVFFCITLIEFYLNILLVLSRLSQ